MQSLVPTQEIKRQGGLTGQLWAGGEVSREREKKKEAHGKEKEKREKKEKEKKKN